MYLVFTGNASLLLLSCISIPNEVSMPKLFPHIQRQPSVHEKKKKNSHYLMTMVQNENWLDNPH